MTETIVSKKVLFDPTRNDRQVELIDAAFSGKYSLIVYGGAIRGGKTFGALGLLLLLHRAFPGGRSKVVRDSLPTLKRNTLPSWNKIKPSRYVERETSQPPEVYFSDSGHLEFFPEGYNEDKDLDRWKGLEANWFVLEEMNELQSVSFWKAFERVGSYVIPGVAKEDQPKPLIIATCNPSYGWVKELVYDRWKNGTLPEDWLYIPAKIHDNPFNPPEYIENLKNMPPFQYQVFVEGNWDVRIMRGGEFYHRFDLDKGIKARAYDPELPLHISFDFNVRPAMNSAVYQIDGKEVFQIDEIVTPEPLNNTRGNCKTFANKYKSHENGLFIYGDPNGRAEDTRTETGYNDFVIIQEELKQFQPRLRVPAKAPNVAIRGSFINSIFGDQYEGIQFSVDPSCLKTIEDLTNVKEAADGTKHKPKEKDPETGIQYEPFGHLSDALDYFLTSAFSSEFLKFKSGNSQFVPKAGRLRRNNLRGSR